MMRWIRSTNKKKPILLLAYAVMCLLTLFCIAAVIRSDSFWNDSAFFSRIIYILCLVFLTLLSGYLIIKKETAGVKRYFILFLLTVHIALCFSALLGSVYGQPQHTFLVVVFSTAVYFLSPVIFLTLWLYQKQFIKESVMIRIINVCIFAAVAVYAGAILLNLFRPVLFLVTYDGTYSDSVKDYFSIVIDLVFLLLLCAAACLSKMSRTRKLSFICCIFSPVLFSVLSLNLDESYKGISVWGLMTIVVLLPICLIFFNANDEMEKDALRREKEKTEFQISAMISQMQPHFLYNCLSVIAALCEEDPGLAAKATNAFSDYLRENISFANKRTPIPFSEELGHIKTYVWLEQLRFPKKLNVEYDIQCAAFYVPALSVQPMVENAVKHGICKTREGGTVRICTDENDQYYTVVVSDNGAGFDTAQAVDDGQHIGIENTRYRIRELVGGSLDIESSPGEGTAVTINIPKNPRSFSYKNHMF